MSQTEDIGTINKWVNGVSAAIQEVADNGNISAGDAKALSRFLSAKSSLGTSLELAAAYSEGGDRLVTRKASAAIVGGLVVAVLTPTVGTLNGFLAGVAVSNFVDENWDTIHNPLPTFDEAIAPGILEGALEISDALDRLFRGLAEGRDVAIESVSEAIVEFLDRFEDEMLSSTLGLSEWLDESVFGFIDLSAHESFDQAKSWTPPQRYDPLALDLDGDGIETTGIGDWQTTTLFDHDGDGIAEGTGWLQGDDAWLARDLDGNGSIDSGAELFGDNTLLEDGSRATDGFAALADLDSNNDGRIDAADAVFDELLVWRDLNQDGRSQADELVSLADSGIASIGTNATPDGAVQNGNLITSQGTFTRTDGSTGAVGNLELAESRFYTEFRQADPSSSELPDVHGAGAVRNLRDAASRSTALQTLLEDYAEGARGDQLALLVPLITQWAGTSSMPTMVERAEAAGFLVLYEFGELPTLSDTAAIEAFGGLVFGESDTADPDAVVRSQSVAGAFGADDQAAYEKWFRMIGVLERFNGEEFVSFDRPTAVNSTVTIDHDAGGGFEMLRIRIEPQQLDLLEQAYDALCASVYDTLLVQTRLGDYLDEVSLTLVDGEVQLDFSSLDARLDASFHANDLDAAWDLADLDRLLGSQLAEAGWTPLGYLSGRFADLDAVMSEESAGVLASAGIGVVASLSGGQLDATAELPDLVGRFGADLLNGDDRDNRLFGGRGDDRLLGADGADHLEGGEGNDDLDGGRGADYLDGGAGDDTLTTYFKEGGTRFRGGIGDDTITGSYRNDTYYYRKGDGRDVIRDSYHYSGSDRLVLEDLDPADVVLTREGKSLLIDVPADGGQIKVENWYAGNGFRIEQLHFADGTSWDVDAIHHAGLEVHGTDLGESLDGLDTAADRLYGAAGDDTLYGKKGDDVLYGGAGNDYLDGGRGADYLDGGAGDDTLTTYFKEGGTKFRGGEGNDTLIGSYRNDTYYYRKGDGRDVIRDSYRYSGSDTLVFEELAHDQLWFERSGNDLVVSTLADSGRITVEGWYRSTMYQIERLESADGLALSNAAIEQLVAAMASFNGPAATDTASPSQIPDELQPTLAAVWYAT